MSNVAECQGLQYALQKMKTMVREEYWPKIPPVYRCQTQQLKVHLSQQALRRFETHDIVLECFRITVYYSAS